MDKKDNYMKDLFYGSGADVKLIFKDGEKINVNRSLLAAKHETFFKLLFADRSSATIEISDFDAETFQLFLDCFMGFNEISNKNVTQIFPVAVKFRIEECITQWLKFLKFEEVNRDLCDSLNVIVSLKMKNLAQTFVEMITKDGRVKKLLEQDDLCHLLEPKSMLLLLNFIEMDSWVYDILFRWGRNYLENNKMVKSLKQFFHEKGFSDFIALTNFDSVESIVKFHNSKLGKDYFLDSEILNHIKKLHFKNICNSKWVKLKNGDFIVEVFHFENLYLDEDSSFQLDIFRNNAVFFEWPINEICPIHYVLSWESFLLSEKPILNICLKGFHEDRDENAYGGIIQVAIKNSGEKGFVLKKMKIKYKFQANCRILKTTPNFSAKLRYEGVEKNLCFTHIFFRFDAISPTPSNDLLSPEESNNPTPKKKKSRSKKKKKNIIQELEKKT